MMRPRLAVVGSANRDLVVQAHRIPMPGETVIGGTFVTAPGGKGGNQAVSAARLGADVWFVGRIGADSFGDSLEQEMRAAGIHTDWLKRDAESPTGVALITVDPEGQNAIVVAPGANSRLCAADIDDAQPAIADAFAVILQLEIPLEAVVHAAAVARAAGTKVLLNPAPVPSGQPLPASLLAQVDVLIPNEHEAARIAGYASPDGLDWEEVARRLLEKQVGSVVITLGKSGCIIADAAGCRHVPAMPVRAVDATAAGDCFTGALAVSLAEGLDLDGAAVFATRAAALSVTRLGAQPSLPTRAELDAFAPDLRGQH